MTIARRIPTAVALLALPGILLAGCSGGSPGGDPSPGAPRADGAVVVENCGVEVAFETAPERVVTIKSTATELMLALGLGDRIIGTAFQDGPVPDEWADAAAGIPQLSERMPGLEAVLELEPDLVFAGWESAFAADAAGERDELAALGIKSYVQPAACRTTGMPEKLDFEEVFREIEELAAIFRVDASDLIAEQRAALASIEKDDRGLTAVWYSSGRDTPYVGAGIGAPQMVLEAVGLVNIFGDLEETWSSVGWESVVAADPDVIVLVDSWWNSADSKKELLAANPATAALTAVQEQRYLVVPFPASEAGVRSVAAAVSLAEQLAALDIPRS